MPSADEAAGAVGINLQPILDDAINELAITVVFTLYNRVPLSSDGTVFWVKQTATLSATGSLHYAVERSQEVDRTIGTTQIIFTAEAEITQFNNIAPGTMWIGTYAGPESNSPALKFAFSSRGRYADAAKVWHYAGLAIFPQFASQIVDDPSQVPDGPIVSNSLPLWLAMNALAPVYPSKLVPENIVPPYIVADIKWTRTLSGFPLFVWPGAVQTGPIAPFHLLAASQQLRDDVELTFFGFTAALHMQFYAGLMDVAMNNNTFGFGNDPQYWDARAHQTEFGIVAQEKHMTFAANYNLNTANATARRLILEAGFASFTAGGFSL